MLLRGFTSDPRPGRAGRSASSAASTPASCRARASGPRAPSSRRPAATATSACPTTCRRAPDEYTYSERVRRSGHRRRPDTVRKRAREQLALGRFANQADGRWRRVLQLRSARRHPVHACRKCGPGVEAAENWGTYATVHAYTPRAVRQAMEAGVRCIEHGQLLDEATAALMAEKDIWWSLQPFLDDRPSRLCRGLGQPRASNWRCSAAPTPPTAWRANTTSRRPGAPTRCSTPSRRSSRARS